jgi:hypothetical protein
MDLCDAENCDAVIIDVLITPLGNTFNENTMHVTEEQN